jgi:dedicator of cytokinesis protein 3
MIDTCLRLHVQICPPEMLVIHEGTLEKFFRKNFREEIQRLVADGFMDDQPMSTQSVRSYPTTLANGSQDQGSVYAQSIHRSVSSASTSRPQQPYPLQLPRQIMSPPPLSPRERTSTSPDTSSPASAQTPLQRHLAHLVRHGFNGVSSRPEGSHDVGEGSPPASMVNLAGFSPTSVASIASGTGATHAGSIKGRFSARFGSLSFGRS